MLPRHRLFAQYLAAIGLASGFAFSAEAREQEEHTEISDIGSLVPLMDEKLAQLEKSKILVVFDIDDTLLTMQQPLGSIAWYDWQRSLDEDDPNALGDQLVDAMSVLFELASMQTVESSTLQLLDDLKSKGMQTLAMTARYPRHLGPTRRELNSNGLEFSSPKNCSAPLCGHNGEITSIGTVDPNNASEKPQKLKRPVQFSDGVLYAAGNDKGEMLELLLLSLPPLSVDAVLFVDDAIENVESVQHRSQAIDIPIVPVLYTHVAKSATNKMTENPDELALGEAWRNLETAICKAVRSSNCEVEDPR